MLIYISFSFDFLSSTADNHVVESFKTLADRNIETLAFTIFETQQRVQTL
jgi:hypothetical protein